MLISAYVS